MNFPFFIAKRYFFAKKKNNAVNIISRVAVAGITIGTAALVIVLSVFNGFEGLIYSLYNAFDPDLKITVNQGKSFSVLDSNVQKLYKLEGIASISEVVEEIALLKHDDRQHIAIVKGVDANYANTTGLDSMLVKGKFDIGSNTSNQAIIGQGIAYYLATNVEDALPITVYIPNRKAGASINPARAFNKNYVMPVGIFQIEQEFDTRYMITTAGFVRKLLSYDSAYVTQLEIKLKDPLAMSTVQRMAEQVLGSNFNVQNRYQQNEVFFKVMQTEKWAIFIILSFILCIASFNIIGSVTMLIVEKKDDIRYLSFMGADYKLINRMVLYQGSIITALGSFMGIFVGAN
ncbi:MAG: ABC transporter permease, partial [Bacteroidales bacterium]|nr:ABC transporter permease [Bacteroidales bacterium]